VCARTLPGFTSINIAPRFAHACMYVCMYVCVSNIRTYSDISSTTSAAPQTRIQTHKMCIYIQEVRCPRVAVAGYGLMHPDNAALYPEYRTNRTKTVSSRSLRAADDKVSMYFFLFVYIPCLCCHTEWHTCLVKTIDIEVLKFVKKGKIVMRCVSINLCHFSAHAMIYIYIYILCIYILCIYICTYI
jgi:hypothetical protein